MNVIKAVVRGGNRQDPRRLAETFEAVTFGKIVHKRADVGAGWREMAPDCNIVLLGRTPGAGLHSEFASFAAKHEHLVRRIAVEFAMEPKDELGRSWFRKTAFCGQTIDLGLNAHMCGSFNLKVAPILILIEFADKRPFEISRTRIMPFDQVAVVSVHDPDEAR